MMNQRMGSRELIFISLLLTAPVVLIGYHIINAELSYQEIRATIASGDTKTLRRWLKELGPEDVMFRTHTFAAGPERVSNALAEAAIRCDLTMVQLFFTVADRKMTEDYLDSALLRFNMDAASRSCPHVGAAIREQIEKRKLGTAGRKRRSGAESSIE